MSLKDLLVKRRALQLKKMSRYAKYVFNDHFVIVMVFLLGALAYQYSEFLKTLTEEFVWGKLAVALLLTAALLIGKLATLVEAADQVFLSSKEKEWQSYFKQVKKKSMLFPGGTLLLLTGIAMPILFVGEEMSPVDFIPIFLSALILKWGELGIQERALKANSEQIVQRLYLLLLACAFAAYLISFFVSPWLGLAFAFVTVWAEEKGMQKEQAEQLALIAWEKAVQMEENRRARINRLLNLFTDVPQARSHAKRRKYLDGIVQVISGKNNPYQYLFSRTFIRGNNYSGLFVRLLLVGILVLLFTSLPAVNIVLNLLFLYVTGFQLVPLYFELDENMLVRLYPQNRKMKLLGFEQFLFWVLGSESIGLAFAAFWGAGWRTSLTALVLNLLFSIIFIRFYAVKRVQKRDPWAF